MATVELLGTDIGEPRRQGSTAATKTGYDLVAGGRDMWDVEDQGHFASLKVEGDFDIQTRMASLGKPHLYTKAGIMARTSLDPDSAHVFLFAFPDNSARNHNNGGVEFQYRPAKGADCVAVYPVDFTSDPALFPARFPQAWLRVKRMGDRFEMFCSGDGRSWDLYTCLELAIGRTVYVGLAVTSHEEDVTVRAEFCDLALSTVF